MVDRIKRIPELRFSNFNSEWQEKKLGDLGKTYTGLSGKTKNDFGFGDSHFITYMNVFKNNIAKFEMTEKVKISNNEKQNKVNYGDIFFTTSSEVPQEVGMASLWLFKTNNVYLNSFCFGFRITINNVLPIFLARYLRSENIRKKITVLAQGSTRFNLSKKEVMKLSINFPEINEQQKIGDFFSKLDRQIELEEQKLSLLEEQKKGYMQKIFSQELRFKNENGNNYPDWEVKKIGEIMDVASVKRIHQSDWTNEGVRFIRARDIVSRYKGKIVEDPLFISKERYEEYSKLSGKVKIGDLLVTGVGTIGVPLLINNEKPIYFKDGNIIWLKNEDNIDKNFLFYSFISRKTQNFIKSVAGIGTVGTYTISNAKKTPILLPVSIEQVKIGNFFNELDKSIKKQNKKVDLLKERKKGFLQKMFV